VNAHLNSYLQHEPDVWAMFHKIHIVDLGRELERNLSERYEVALVESLQFAQTDPHEPDLFAFVVRLARDKATPPILRVELVSPIFKQAGLRLRFFDEQRLTHEETKTSLILIDYVHEFEAIVGFMPGHPMTKQHPYNISIVSPTLDSMISVSSDVDSPLPYVQSRWLRLSGKDLPIDIDNAYQETFNSMKLFSRVVNYAEEPVNFASYSPADQARIRAVMQRAAEGERES
jgi:hypothetical protein